jgi:LysM repeat protein
MGLTHFQPDVDGAIKDTVKKAGDRTVKEVSKSEAAEQKAKEAARKVADEIPGTPGTPPLAGGKASSSTTVSRGTYTVKKGDTLSKIASRTGQSLKSLAKKNPNIKNLNRIRVGQQVNT